MCRATASLKPMRDEKRCRVRRPGAQDETVGAPPARRAARRDPGVGVRASRRALLRLRPVRRPRGVLDCRAHARPRPGAAPPSSAALRRLAVQRRGVQALRHFRVRLLRPDGSHVRLAERGRLRDPPPLGLRAPPGVRGRAHDRCGAVRDPDGHRACERHDPRLAGRPGGRRPSGARRATRAPRARRGAPRLARLLREALGRLLPPRARHPLPRRGMAARPVARRRRLRPRLARPARRDLRVLEAAHGLLAAVHLVPRRHVSGGARRPGARPPHLPRPAPARLGARHDALRQRSLPPRARARAYRATLMAVLHEVRARRPPMLVTEGWLTYFLSSVYLNDLARETQVVQIPLIYNARDYEAWLQRRQPDFAPGTFLLTGFGSCVHYGAIRDGFRLALFQDGLHPAWKVLKDYGPLAYHPLPEPVRLWELAEPIPRGQPPPADRVERSLGPEELFKTGMARFDEGKPTEAAPYFHTVATGFPDSAFAEDAEYFYTICLFREGRWQETIAGFEELVRRRPAGRWVPAAYYHIGLSYAELGDHDRAREPFETLRRQFPREETLGGYAAEQLVLLDAQAGWFERLRKRLGIR